MTAVAAAVLAPIALTVAFSERRRFLIRLAALFLAAWCLAFGVIGSLGYVSTAREAGNAERSCGPRGTSSGQGCACRARDELIQLNASKSTQWRAARAKELQAVMADAAKAMKAVPTVAVVDPQSASLAHYLVAAGYEATPETVSTWLTAFTVSSFEIASAFALIVARASALHPTTRQKAAGEQLSAGPSIPGVVEDQAAAKPEARETGKDDQGEDAPAPLPRGKPGRRPTVMPEEAVAKLRERGGRANGSIRGVGRLLGVRSKTAAHRLLHQLASAGLVKLSASPHGVVVALA